MAIATSNRLLPILAGMVLLMLVFVALKSCSLEEGDAVLLDRVPQAPAPDADTPADTIKTLTANVAAMTAEVEALRRDNTSLRKDNQALITSRTQIEENVATRVKRELLARDHDQENRARIESGVLSSLTSRVDALADIFVGLPSEGQQGPTHIFTSKVPATLALLLRDLLAERVLGPGKPRIEFFLTTKYVTRLSSMPKLVLQSVMRSILGTCANSSRKERRSSYRQSRNFHSSSMI